MKKTLVINLTRITQDVPVRHLDNTKDYIQIAPQGRVQLRDGLTIDTRWLQTNPNTVNIVKPVEEAKAPDNDKEDA